MPAFPTTCPLCNGDSGFEGRPHGYDPVTGAPRTTWDECTACDGTGVVEEPDEPRTLEDLEIEDMEMAL